MDGIDYSKNKTKVSPLGNLWKFEQSDFFFLQYNICWYLHVYCFVSMFGWFHKSTRLCYVRSLETLKIWSFLFGNTFVHPRMDVGVSVTVRLFLDIRAHHCRWKDSFLSPLFIRISKHNGWWRKYPHPYVGVQNPLSFLLDFIL
jgi:hypothetical protein